MTPRHIPRRRAQATAVEHGRFHRRDEAAIHVLRIPPRGLRLAGPHGSIDVDSIDLLDVLRNLLGQIIELLMRHPHIARGLNNHVLFVRPTVDLGGDFLILIQRQRRRRGGEHLRGRGRGKPLICVALPHHVTGFGIDHLAAESGKVFILSELIQLRAQRIQVCLARLCCAQRLLRSLDRLRLPVREIAVFALEGNAQRSRTSDRCCYHERGR